MFNAQSEDGHEKYTDGKTTIDTIGPVINLLSPVNNATVYKTHIDIKGEYIELHLSRIQLINMTTQYVGTAVIDTDKTQFIITNVIIADKTNKIIVKAYDTAGNISISTLQLYGLKSLTTVVSTTQDNEIHFGEIDILIPEGYSPCDIDLVVEIDEEDDLPENLGQISDVYKIYPIGEDGNSCFLSNILITINYDESKLGISGEDALQMYIKYFPDQSRGQVSSTNWERIHNVIINTQNNTITAIVQYLSRVAAGKGIIKYEEPYESDINKEIVFPWQGDPDEKFDANTYGEYTGTLELEAADLSANESTGCDPQWVTITASPNSHQPSGEFLVNESVEVTITVSEKLKGCQITISGAGISNTSVNVN